MRISDSSDVCSSDLICAKWKRRERRSTRAIEGAPPMDTPQDPPPMPPAKIIVYAITLPLSLLLLIFWPAGSLGWRPGWLFVAIVVIGFGVSGLVLARVNPDRKSTRLTSSH